MRRRNKACLALFVFFPLLPFLAPLAVPGMLHGSAGDNGGAHVDLVVRRITVAPARAFVGDVIRIEMEWEYWGDMINNHYDTTYAEILANGKPVARKPFVYNYGARLGDAYRETFLWDTKGTAPGEYRIRGQVPLRLDATPFDNFLVVKDPLILIPEGARFPSGEERGGTLLARNPFWVER